jgi:hypothetical protein
MRTQRSRRLVRILSVSVGLLLTVGVAGAVPASADDLPDGTVALQTADDGQDNPVQFPGDGIPDDQPIPPYTINNPPLTPATIGGQPTQVLQGVRRHGAYIIEVPPQWNGDLVMWTHGYRGQGTVLTSEVPAFGLRLRVLNQGYAWAASSYYDNGFDIRAGVLSTQDLAELFGSIVGKPHRTYIAGVSMGGYIIGRSVEQFPSFYAGALPMCGVLGDQSLLDFYLDYNLVAQDLAGVDVYPVPANYLTTTVPQIQQALGLVGLSPFTDTTNALGKQLRSIVINRSGGPRPGAVASFAVWKDFLFGIAVPQSTGTTLAENPGVLSTNLDTDYEPNSPVDVNATVRRVAPADLMDRISPILTQVPQIAGRPTVPVLTLHDLGDMFVPFSMEEAYAQDVAQHARTSLVVQRAIRASSHCEFTPTEAGTAWDDLVNWVSTDTRPAGDDVADPATVAEPNFGCQFSDPAAFAAGIGTRRLFPACT